MKPYVSPIDSFASQCSRKIPELEWIRYPHHTKPNPRPDQRIVAVRWTLDEKLDTIRPVVVSDVTAPEAFREAWVNDLECNTGLLVLLVPKE